MNVQVKNFIFSDPARDLDWKRRNNSKWNVENEEFLDPRARYNSNFPRPFLDTEGRNK